MPTRVEASMTSEITHPGTNSLSALITGTSSGIGGTTTRLLDREGWRVFAGVRRDADADELRSECSERVTPLLMDVTQQSQIDQALKDVSDALGAAPLTAIVNNAGIGFGGPLEHCDLEEMRNGFEVNVFGPMAVTRAFLPLMRRGSSGRIVNVSSAAGLASTPLIGPYCASKFALEALSDALRMELRKSGIFVTVVEPGFTDTPMQSKGRDQVEQMRAALPPVGLERYGDAIDKFAVSLARFSARASAPEKVASAIVDALTASRPRTRVSVGMDAKLVAGVMRWLPARLRDAVLGGMVGL
jgi:NAD(P)-dependent dehydrogenase (short-subunit alcohol dehydrogenase family)